MKKNIIMKFNFYRIPGIPSFSICFLQLTKMLGGEIPYVFCRSFLKVSLRLLEKSTFFKCYDKRGKKGKKYKCLKWLKKALEAFW